MKKGPLSEIEKCCIQHIKNQFSVNEIATLLNRNASIVKKFIDTNVLEQEVLPLEPPPNKLIPYKIAGNDKVIVMSESTASKPIIKSNINNRKIKNDIFKIDPNKK